MEDYNNEAINQLEELEYKRKMEFRKNLPSYVWLVIKDLVILFITITVFEYFGYDSFEQVVISLLAIILFSVWSFSTNYEYKTIQLSVGLMQEFHKIREGLKQEEEDFETANKDKALKSFNKSGIILGIHSIFLFIYLMISLFSLISAISY